MIVNKQNGEVISGNEMTPFAPKPKLEGIDKPIQVPANGIISVTKAIMEILENATWEYGVPDSPKIFKTVQWNDGQYNRIVMKGSNQEYALAFPAAFVHFIETEYLVSQQRIGEGRAKLRIQFILNRLNNHDKECELDHLYVAQRIDQEITLHKGEYECLSERCQIIYWDFPESFDDGLQPGWLTYEVWFREEYIWRTRNVVQKRIVIRPFTNHSDQLPENNENGHVNGDHPASYDEATSFTR